MLAVPGDTGDFTQKPAAVGERVRVWQEIDLSALAGHEQFLGVAS